MSFKKSIFVVLVVVSLVSSLTCGYAEEDERGRADAGTEKKGLISEAAKIPEKIIKKTLEAPVKLIGGVFGFELQPLVITPFRAEDYGYNVSKNTSVITSKEIEQIGPLSFSELLSHTPGVASSQLLGNSKSAAVDIRGFGGASHSNVLVLVDGRRTNQIDLSGVDWAQLNLNSIERVEIVRGASSVMYGDNATGGVINIITKRGRSTEPAVNIGASYGSYSRHTEYGSFDGYHEIMDYFFSYAHEDGNGYRENNALKTNTWFGRISLHPVELFELGVSAGYHRDMYGMPGALVPINFDFERVGRRGTAFPYDKGKTEELFVTSEPKIKLELGGSDITASTFGSWKYRKSEGLNPWVGQLYQTDYRISSGDIRPKLEINSKTSDEKIDNTFVFGADYFTAVNNVMSGDILVIRDDVYVSKTTLGIYGHENVKLFDKLLINGGYRYEWAHYGFDQQGQATTNESQDINEWAWEFGGGYKYNPSSQAYAIYSRSFRYPNTDEYYQPIAWWGGGGFNSGVQQQVGHNFEVGLKDNSLEWLTVNADFFWIDTKREIYYDHLNRINTNYAGKVKRYGFEIESKANFNNGRFSPYCNYTFQKVSFAGGDYDNNSYPFVPRNLFSAGINIIPITNLNWNIATNYIGSCYSIGDQRNAFPKQQSHLTLDSKLSYKWKSFTVYGLVKNIFNRKYSAYTVLNMAGTDVGQYPSPGTYFEIGCSSEF